MKPLIAIDSMILTYLVDAVYDGVEPGRGDAKLAAERLAAFRIALWSQLALGIGETVERQYLRIPDALLRRRHELVDMVFVVRLNASTSNPAVQRRVRDLLRYCNCNDHEDCQVVAESESAKAQLLLTYDDALIRRLAGQASVRMLRPSEYWQYMAIPRGTPPVRYPLPSNPWATASWWRW